ncbi:MAG: hypothetical protein ACLFS3_01850 [Candidatus Aenigmatarchaeota archaeon]
MRFLETAIDDLVEYLRENDTASLKKISQEIGYPEDVVEEWARVLEDHDILKIEYGLTKTKLVLKEHKDHKKNQAKEKIKKDKKEKAVCDICGRSFANEHGLAIHKGKIHKNN